MNNKVQIVLVKWIDSMSDDGRWHWNKDFNIKKLEEQQIQYSVGIITKENKKNLTLAGSWGYVFSDGYQNQIINITIPKCSIKNIKKINV
jgi:hypothetical protein